MSKLILKSSVGFTDSAEVGAYLQRGESIVFQEGEADDWHQQELDAEGVVLRVVGVPEAHVDQVHGGIGHGQEHHLVAESQGL